MVFIVYLVFIREGGREKEREKGKKKSIYKTVFDSMKCYRVYGIRYTWICSMQFSMIKPIFMLFEVHLRSKAGHVMDSILYIHSVISGIDWSLLNEVTELPIRLNIESHI